MSAPSGAGKTTLYNGLRKIHPEIKLSVSCTTRPRRSGEVNGRDYRFISEAAVRCHESGGRIRRMGQGPRQSITARRACPSIRACRTGRDILLDIDVQGARKIKRSYPEAVSIFLLPPSLEELKRRLSARGTDGQEMIGAGWPMRRVK